MKYIAEKKMTISVYNFKGFLCNLALIESFINVIVPYNIVVEKN